MGDHRASVKIEMEFHGVKDSTDMWINYYPEDCCSMDKRVVDFFRDVYSRGMAAFHADVEELERANHEAQTQKVELEELARLKAKYNA